jgi:hypothetical protein
MGLFRRNRDETQNEILLREAGLDPAAPATVADDSGDPGDDAPAPVDPYDGTYPAQDPVGIWTRAMARPGQYDAVVTVHAPELGGTKAEFAALPDGDLIVDVETGDSDLSPLAEAVEKHLRPPYRAVARREDRDLWAVAARQIDVLRLDFDGGDGIELVRNEGKREIRVDGEPWTGEIPGLEGAGEALGEDYVVHADRLDGDLWEVQASPL